MKDWCHMTMTDDGWEPAAIPPANARRVMLRFDYDGQRDCEGFYWRPERSWYLSKVSKAKKHAVHPIAWREIER